MYIVIINVYLHVFVLEVSCPHLVRPVLAAEERDEDAKVGGDPPCEDLSPEGAPVEESLQDAKDGDGAGEGLEGEAEGPLQQDVPRSRPDPLKNGQDE